jgi:cell division protease FtsH
MASEIDEEIRTIIEDAYATAEKLLTENIDKLHTIAKALLEIETLDADQFEALFSGTKTTKQIIDEVHKLEKVLEEANALEAAEDLEEEDLEETSEDEGEYLDEEEESAREDEITPEGQPEDTPEEKK